MVTNMKRFPTSTNAMAPHSIMPQRARTIGRPNAETTFEAVTKRAVSLKTFDVVLEKSSVKRLAIIVGTGAKA